MKIYTKTGDKGETGLIGGERVAKDHARIEAYGTVDELNALLGAARRAGASSELDAQLESIQNELFVIGSQLASPKENDKLPVLEESSIRQLESWIDEAEEKLPALKQFILPGGGPTGSMLHLARTVCRRTERRVHSLSRETKLPGEIPVFLNRLSDYLFTVARLANLNDGVGDVPWKPEKGLL
ncbi:cob(I)yrinic acid a,c-diamide adenosyltransferase [bacterium]|nr:cob(I)yrinic acid a,c-diamide adenosyltransferase [bacterium]